MTTQESAEVRIAQQDGTSNPEKLEKLYNLDITALGISSYDIEQKIHGYYDRLGKRVRDHREWFIVEGGIDEIKAVIESIIGNKDIHKTEVKLKPHQIEANNKINQCFTDGKLCLLAHKPRSGKTFTTIYNIKENGYKNVLILTSYPVLNFQWEETIDHSKGFSDTNVILGTTHKLVLSEKKNIVLLSLQDVKGGEEVFEKEKFDSIKDIEWDLVVIDEVHYGVETFKTEDFLNKIKYKRLLGLSATPTKNLLCGRFTPDQVHSYTLVEESKLKKQYPDLYNYADINWYLWSIIESERKELEYFSDEEQIKFDKLFRVEDDQFYYKNDISYLFKNLIGDREVCKRDKLGTLYPLKNNGEFSAVQSILLFVPNIAAQNKLKELLEDMESFSSDFNIHITNSEENSSKQLIKKIRRDFKSTSEKRSLIIAVDQLTTGITLDDCDMVVMMNDWMSIDKYIQASFRCQSPRDGKTKCFVLDLNPARSFELLWEYNNVISRNNGKSVGDNLREWLECVNIFNRVEGGFKQIDFESFNQEYNKIVAEKPRFNYSSVIFSDKLEEAEKALTVIGLKGGSSSTEDDLDEEEGVGKGKSKKVEKKGGVGKKEIDEISPEKLMEIAKALIDKTMLLSIFTGFKYSNVDECFNDLISDNVLVKGLGVLKRDMYMETLLLGMNDVDRVSIGIVKHIYDVIFDKDIVNKKLFLFNNKVKSIYNIGEENLTSYHIMLANAQQLLESYLKPSNTEKKLLGEVYTPMYNKPGCVNDQLSLLDESFWKDKNRKVLDPCAGTGAYSIVLVDKFMNGLMDVILDPEERKKWILEEIIHVNEFQAKNLFIYLNVFDPENKYKMKYNLGDYLTFDSKAKWGIEKWDLICSNPPYQELDGGAKASARPMYNLFTEKAIKESDKVIFITPSRWFAGGKGLDAFRKMMINSNKIKSIDNFPDATKVFGSDVEIKGGVSYFLYDNKYKGNLKFNKEDFNFSKYDIVFDPKFSSIIDRFSNLESISILCKGRGDNVFGIQTNDKRFKDKGDVLCYVSKQKGSKKFLDISEIKNTKYIDTYKVITVEAATRGGEGFGNIFYSNPGSVVNGSYIWFLMKNEEECKSMVSYLNTKFSNLLLSLRKISQHIKPDTLKWIPIVPFDREWTDEKLYEYFGLSEEERKLIDPNYKK
jgi:superfamily II DNA or RNA helicase/tRNA1(Val) A37 N6-methylase TrmN6